MKGKINKRKKERDTKLHVYILISTYIYSINKMIGAYILRFK